MSDSPLQQVSAAPEADPGPRRIDLLIAQPAKCVSVAGPDEVVVCGRRDDERYHLRELSEPPVEDLLTTPLRVQIAAGVTFGFQPGGGIGLKADVGEPRRNPPAAVGD